ncbi:hypothetical protein KAR91_35680 [Candidatus Pacearchaeota archaeon]|nr:hypothetical protein [Candidatus Pacearchaeota archaeon]
MKSSELKPKLLTILFKLFETDASPSAVGTIESLLNSVKGATPEKILKMLQHLEHVGLVDIQTTEDNACASINDKGIRWLDEHNEYLKQKSMKHWLLKPALVAFIVCIITTPTVIAIQGGIATQSEPLSQDQNRSQLCKKKYNDNQESIFQSLSCPPK